MRDNWQLFHAELPKEFCEELIQGLQKYPPQKASTFNNSTSVRSSTVRWIDGERGLCDILMNYVNIANSNAFLFDISRVISELQFTEYHGTSEDWYGWHHDIEWNSGAPYDRKISVVVQLSDPSDYEGGKFEFDEVETPDNFDAQGSILIFPSYLRHQVTPVTSGKRYSLVSWVRGPRWR